MSDTGPAIETFRCSRYTAAVFRDLRFRNSRPLHVLPRSKAFLPMVIWRLFLLVFTNRCGKNKVTAPLIFSAPIPPDRYALRHKPFSGANLSAAYTLHRHMPFNGTHPSAAHALQRHIPFTDTCPSTAHTFHRHTPFNGTYLSPIHALQRHIPFTGTYPSTVHALHRHMPFSSAYPSAAHALHRHIPFTKKAPSSYFDGI